MSIISLKFLLLVICLLFIYYIIPQKYRWIILLLGSIVFYYLSSSKLIIFICLSIISIFFIGLKLTKYNEQIKALDKEQKDLKNKYQKKKKRILLFGIVLNILFIIFTKYYNFTISNINIITGIFNIKPLEQTKILILLLGISYYTLEAISYIVDIYRGKYSASKNPFKVALFLLYFPKITEGPISRFDELSKEFFTPKKIDFNSITIGLDLIVLGLFKKMVIADRAGIYVNNVFGKGLGGSTVIVAIILYTLQIYAEFSGCIDIVRGVSYLFNIKLPLNFKSPFFAKDVQEFWRRWHISLGAWIKEYVFYPISLSKMNMKVVMFAKKHFNNYFYKFISAAFPLLFVWLVNGIWHGASYKYIFYGMYYYIFMMIGLLIEPLSSKTRTKLKINVHIINVIHIIRTIIIVIFGMALFRSTSIAEFFNLIGSIFTKGSGIYEYGIIKIDFIILIIGTIILLLIDTLSEFNKINIEEGFTKKVIIRSLIYTILICSIVILGIYGEGYDASSFIYGAF